MLTIHCSIDFTKFLGLNQFVESIISLNRISSKLNYFVGVSLVVANLYFLLPCTYLSTTYFWMPLLFYIFFILANPPVIPGLPWDLTYHPSDPGI